MPAQQTPHTQPAAQPDPQTAARFAQRIADAERRTRQHDRQTGDAEAEAQRRMAEDGLRRAIEDRAQRG